MAVERSLGTNNEPENGVARDFNAEQERAIKARIEEYKTHGRDTDHLQERLTKLQNLKKGRRKSNEGEKEADRADSTTGMAGEEKKLLEREKGQKQKKGAGVPDQKSEESANPEADAGPKPDVPDQKSPWPAKKPEHAITQPEQPKQSGPQGSADPKTIKK